MLLAKFNISLKTDRAMVLSYRVPVIWGMKRAANSLGSIVRATTQPQNIPLTGIKVMASVN